MQEPDGCRKCRAASRLRQARDPLRSADPNLFVEDQSCKLAHPMQLTSPTGQDNASAREFIKAASLQPISDKLEGLLDPRRDNADKQRFRHMIYMTVILLANLWDGDHLALVGA